MGNTRLGSCLNCVLILRLFPVEMFTDIIDGGFHAPPTLIIISQGTSLEYAGAKLHQKNYKRWDEVHDASETAMESSATPPLLAPRDSKLGQETASDPMLVMGHLDK